MSKIRMILRERDGDYCGLCTYLIWFEAPLHHDCSQSIDHIRPRSKGGSVYSMRNMRLAHRWCNMSIGNSEHTEHLTQSAKHRKRIVTTLRELNLVGDVA